jgi:hypothetical protein
MTDLAKTRMEDAIEDIIDDDVFGELFEGVETAEEIDEEPEEDDEIEDVVVESPTDMQFKKDFELMRTDIIDTNVTLTELITGIIASMVDLQKDKSASRKAETVAQIAKVKLEGNKQLMELYKKKNDLLGIKAKDKEIAGEKKGMTTEDVLKTINGTKREEEHTI